MFKRTGQGWAVQGTHVNGEGLGPQYQGVEIAGNGSLGTWLSFYTLDCGPQFPDLNIGGFLMKAPMFEDGFQEGARIRGVGRLSPFSQLTATSSCGSSSGPDTSSQGPKCKFASRGFGSCRDFSSPVAFLRRGCFLRSL